MSEDNYTRHKTQRTTVEKRKEALKKYNSSPERKARLKEYYQQNKSRWKKYTTDRYGITVDQYNQMLAEQDDRCFICHKHRDEFSRDLSIDHCHETGKVRKLLCINCNRALGMLREDVDLMKKLIDYVESQC